MCSPFVMSTSAPPSVKGHVHSVRQSSTAYYIGISKLRILDLCKTFGYLDAYTLVCCNNPNYSIGTVWYWIESLLY